MNKKTIRKVLSIGLSAAMLIGSMSMAFAETGVVEGNQTFKQQQTVQSSAIGASIVKNDGTAFDANDNGAKAQITLGKILTATAKNKFPNVEDFIFKIEKVDAWKLKKDNVIVPNDSVQNPVTGNTTNTSVEADAGQKLTKAQMPMFEDDTTTNHKYVYHSTKDDENGIASYVSVGNFKDSVDSAQGSGVYQYPADTTTVKQRSTNATVNFKNYPAGYYVYKVSEVGSVPNTIAENGHSIYENYQRAQKNVRGVDYDPNEYFIVFYLMYRTDENGDTTDEVYVHSITSWTNENGSEDFYPNLTDIQNVLDTKDADHSGDTDKDAIAAEAQPDKEGDVKPDSAWSGGNWGDSGDEHGATDAEKDKRESGEITHNYGKVGVSANTVEVNGDVHTLIPSKYSDKPNKLNAFRMWNYQTTRDVVITENVKGMLGDRNQEFAFKITLDNLEPGQEYFAGDVASLLNGYLETDEADDGQKTTTGRRIIKVEGGAEAIEAQDKGGTGDAIVGFTSSTIANNNGLNGDSYGQAVIYIALKDDETFVIKDLPLTARYVVEQLPSNHVTSYDITSSNKDRLGDVSPILENVSTKADSEGTNGVVRATNTGNASNQVTDTALVHYENTESEKLLVAKEQTISRYDETVTEAWTNTRTMATVTGMPQEVVSFIMAAAILLLLAGIFVTRRHQFDDEI